MRAARPFMGPVAMALVLSGLATAAVSAQVEEGTVGSEACRECHDLEFEDYRRSIHFQGRDEAAEDTGCESCHGPGAEHVRTEGDISFIFSYSDPLRTVKEKVDRCLSCHEGDVESFQFMSSDHMKGTIDCSACHQPHLSRGNDGLLPRPEFEACLSCHQEIQAASHLRVCPGQSNGYEIVIWRELFIDLQ